MPVDVGAGVVRGGPCNELKEDVNGVIIVVSTGSINREVNATGVDIKSIMIASDVVNIPLVSDTSVVADGEVTVGPGICTAQTNTKYTTNTSHVNKHVIGGVELEKQL